MYGERFRRLIGASAATIAVASALGVTQISAADAANSPRGAHYVDKTDDVVEQDSTGASGPVRDDHAFLQNIDLSNWSWSVKSSKRSSKLTVKAHLRDVTKTVQGQPEYGQAYVFKLLGTGWEFGFATTHKRIEFYKGDISRSCRAGTARLDTRHDYVRLRVPFSCFEAIHVVRAKIRPRMESWAIEIGSSDAAKASPRLSLSSVR